MASLTAERLRQVLDYDKATGTFMWLKGISNRAPAGKEAGCRCRRSGYILIGIDGRLYPAHRLAWMFVHGVMPDEIDHRDGDRANNKIQNLRSCTHAENQKNVPRPSHNTSGFKGVHFHPQTGKWRARIKSDGKHKSLGLHQTPEAAHAAYCAAATAMHGEFARFQ